MRSPRQGTLTRWTGTSWGQRLLSWVVTARETSALEGRTPPGSKPACRTLHSTPPSHLSLKLGSSACRGQPREHKVVKCWHVLLCSPGGHQKCYVAVAKRCNQRLQQIIGLWPTAGWWSPRDVTIEVSVFRVCGVPQVGGLREHICEQDVCDEGWAARVAGVGV